MLKYIILIITSIIVCDFSKAQDSSEGSYKVIKIGGIGYKYKSLRFVDNNQTNVKGTFWAIGLAYENKWKNTEQITLEYWANYFESRSEDNFFNREFMLGVQANWYPLHSFFEYDFIHASAGLAYYKDRHNRRPSYEGLGFTFGIGIHYLFKNKILVYADKEIFPFYNLNDYYSRKTFITATPIIIGVGLKLN